MKSLKIAFLLGMLAALPALAQAPVDVNVFASWVDAQGDNVLDEGVETNFESGTGFGIGVNWFWGPRFSTELSASALSLDAGIDFDGEPTVDLGSVDLTPIIGTFQFHFARDSVIDPYVGVGAAYVLADDLESDDLDELEIGAIEVDDEITYVLNAGLGVRLTDTFGLYLDGKYVPLEPATRAPGDEEDVDLEINPLIVSAGLRLRF
ncbi:MAG TPA: OmpW family outer membrane protein [Thermoanaerobaculia bacterium]